MASSRFGTLFMLPSAALAVVLFAGSSWAVDLGDLMSRPLGDGEAFRPVTEGRLAAAAARLRETLGPLDRLLARSPSGVDWKKYLDWPASLPRLRPVRPPTQPCCVAFRNCSTPRRTASRCRSSPRSAGR